ncbi:MAG TPA: hypothetical protein VGZ00_10180 [Candidatus Baltobacteraceae bacterium]|jgi:hypothetical protein|nr:hypothetical protein [Candidatus Baltobacteraceae bacterium]
MNQQADSLNPEAKAIWTSLCNNALVAKLSELYTTPEVGFYGFNEARKRLVEIRDAVRELISGKDTELNPDEHLAFINASGVFLNKFNAFAEKNKATSPTPRGADAAQAQRYYREAIDAIEPLVKIAKKRLWPDTHAVHQTPEWNGDLPPDMQSGPKL